MIDAQSEAFNVTERWPTWQIMAAHVFPIEQSNGEIQYMLRRRNPITNCFEYWCQQWGDEHTTFSTATEAEAKLKEILAAERCETVNIDQLKYLVNVKTKAMLDLQAAINRHCSGHVIPEAMAQSCAYHVEALNRDLASHGAVLTQSQRERIAKLLAAKAEHDRQHHNCFNWNVMLHWTREAETLLRELVG